MAIDELLAGGSRQAAGSQVTGSERYEFAGKIESSKHGLKKMKSTLPDVGLLKYELQQENERLR